jgi:hypothetical protein
VPVADVGTDRERLDTWSKEAAIKASQVVRDFGLERKGLVEESLICYIASFLDGIWLRAPYLHNGSVPTLRDLLEPVDKRPKVFFRGYDVHNQVKGGFVTSRREAEQIGLSDEHERMKLREEVERIGTRYDVSQGASSNQRHVFGTDLSDKGQGRVGGISEDTVRVPLKFPIGRSPATSGGGRRPVGGSSSRFSIYYRSGRQDGAKAQGAECLVDAAGVSPAPGGLAIQEITRSRSSSVYPTTRGRNPA